MPDIFVPEDTVNMTSYYKEALYSRLIPRFSFLYTDNNRSTLRQYETPETLVRYLNCQNIINKFAVFGEQKGLRRRNLLIKKSYGLLEKAIYGNIVYNMLDFNAYTKYMNEDDPTVLRAVYILEKGLATPKPPRAVYFPQSIPAHR
jgi:carboxyl-terminal processing protease